MCLSTHSPNSPTVPCPDWSNRRVAAGSWTQSGSNVRSTNTTNRVLCPVRASRSGTSSSSGWGSARSNTAGTWAVAGWSSRWCGQLSRHSWRCARPGWRPGSPRQPPCCTRGDSPRTRSVGHSSSGSLPPRRTWTRWLRRRETLPCRRSGLNCGRGQWHRWQLH